ncbi:chemotaxis protein CheA [Acetobacter sp. TBRC 12305]|uniref:Chemotaxis protein CheA n=1 Tax=Acetobacter garciniae TaxID=2817435 RepID=A0A939KM03_9PROT|nr:chemotaxis protein CheA [Acetobacter garciniae]MBO1324773.1 chemotaxis protein CheA [Acetobacter garciniae]MBX0344464.1 chemotaxis protein CheA [Acetobacter garciniae]
MSDDMDDILQVFYQECDEQLQELERGLAVLADGESGQETINAVFRAVHSIKGGAASFGLDNLVRFAHVFESSLDGLRSGRVVPTPDVVKTFLKAMDVLSDLVTEAREGTPVDPARIAESQVELEAIISTGGAASAQADIIPQDFVPVPMDFEPVPMDFEPVPVAFEPVPVAFEPVPVDFDFGADTQAEPATGCLVVTFRPHDALYERGDDARNMLNGLADLAAGVPGGHMTTTCDFSALPVFEAVDPLKSYLAWRVVLPPEVTEDSVTAVFDWVSDACDVTTTREDGAQANPAAALLDEEPHAQAPAVPAPTVPDNVVQDSAPVTAARDVVAEHAHPTEPASPVASTAAPVSQDVHAAGGAHPHPAAAGGAARKTEQQASIRVDLHRIDGLMDLVGELVIAQAAIESLSRRTDPAAAQELMQGIGSMQSLTRDIQDAVMAVRAQPVRGVFQRMQRVVREACSMTKKDVVLTLEGEDTEVDRTLVEKLTDPLTHMLRNAVDHGIEKVEDRLAAGKPAQGHILLSAGHRSGRILITIKDDGAGINRQRVLETAIKRGIVAPDAQLTDDEINNLIFAPGFSTAATVSDLSGRGVGMDVVKQAILSLGGRVAIQSVPGEGTTFSLSLPLTLAVLDGMLIAAGGSTMVIPISSVVEAMMIDQRDVYVLPDGGNVISIRGSCMPFIPLAAALGLAQKPSDEDIREAVILVVENESGGRAALVVDEIRDQTQVVIKSIEKNYRQIEGVSAATILGDGSVSLILDVSALIAATVGRMDKALDPRRGMAA